jgi:hypothetical protein
MTPDEIRTTNEIGQAKVADASTSPAAQDIMMRSLQVSILAEIAAQLAELNETLRKEKS